MSLSEELKWRGFVNQTTLKDIKQLDEKPLTFYWGVDPSAPSMTIGNLAAAMMVKHFINAGHKAYLLIGGATGMVGDPDGKAQERDLLDAEQISANKKAIVDQYKTIFEDQKFHIVDNYDWFKDIGYLEFLRTVGKHVPLRQMLGRDFIQTRLEGAGISYAEFSYVMVQAYDFAYLNRHHEVTLQLCGSDQWGNSIAGVDLARRLNGNEVHVWSSPLVVNKATGAKFGKTEDGAIWLDAKLTSHYKFYQFWLNIDDDSALDFLKIYTFLSQADIDHIHTEMRNHPQTRKAQKTLASEVTKLVHGAQVAKTQEHISNVLFGNDEFKLSGQDFEVLSREFKTVPYSEQFHTMVVEAGLASSVSEARRLDLQNAFTLNGNKVTPGSTPEFAKGMNLLRCGKNSFAVIKK